jgi:hypothetical protein
VYVQPAPSLISQSLGPGSLVFLLPQPLAVTSEVFALLSRVTPGAVVFAGFSPVRLYVEFF